MRKREKDEGSRVEYALNGPGREPAKNTVETFMSMKWAEKWIDRKRPGREPGGRLNQELLKELHGFGHAGAHGKATGAHQRCIDRPRGVDDGQDLVDSREF